MAKYITPRVLQKKKTTLRGKNTPRSTLAHKGDIIDVDNERQDPDNPSFIHEYPRFSIGLRMCAVLAQLAHNLGRKVPVGAIQKDIHEAYVLGIMAQFGIQDNAKVIAEDEAMRGNQRTVYSDSPE